VGQQPAHPAQHLGGIVHGAFGGQQLHGLCPELIGEPPYAQVQDGVGVKVAASTVREILKETGIDPAPASVSCCPRVGFSATRGWPYI
jgi:hypothetical protein